MWGGVQQVGGVSGAQRGDGRSSEGRIPREDSGGEDPREACTPRTRRPRPRGGRLSVGLRGTGRSCRLRPQAAECLLFPDRLCSTQPLPSADTEEQSWMSARGLVSCPPSRLARLAGSPGGFFLQKTLLGCQITPRKGR